MGRIVDITDKLSFNENPKLKIKGELLEVNADATTMLKIMGMFKEEERPKNYDVIKMYNLIFGEKEREKIDRMKLQFEDFQTLVGEAIDLVAGQEEEEQGEQ